MSKLFGRSLKLTIGTLEVSALDCVFKVKKSLKPEPNTCDLKVFNLSEKSRKLLETGKPLEVRLEAGYGKELSQLYLGQVRAAHSMVDGPDIVTEMSTGDGEKEIASARISVPVGPGAPVATALLAIVRALGLKEGNAATAAGQLSAKGLAFFGPGTVIHGNAAQALTDFCRSADLEWSVQDGKIQILDRGKALEGKAVELTSSTGLVGSPAYDGAGKLVKARALLIPELRPGRKVTFDSTAVKGGFRIVEVEYTGDTAGSDWFADLTCQKY